MRIAINGFGRVGRCVLRAAYERQLLSTSDSQSPADTFDLVAINEIADAETLAYLTQYDSTHGRFPAKVHVANDCLQLAGLGERTEIVESTLLAIPEVSCLPWDTLDVDCVLECTGEVKTLAEANDHLDAGAEQVILSNPGESSIPAIVYGVNHQELLATGDFSPKTHRIVSAASCTSNALLPAVAALDEAFGVDSGVVTTIHAAMHDQPVIDAYHGSDLRKNRASSQSFIPVATELASGVGRVLPHLTGRFVAQAIRVPVTNVSALNVTLNLKKTTINSALTPEMINDILRQAGIRFPAEVLSVSDLPLASCDFIHDPCSGTIDAQQTQVVGDGTVNLLIWFDNEWAFANRMLDILLLLQQARSKGEYA